LFSKEFLEIEIVRKLVWPIVIKVSYI